MHKICREKGEYAAVNQTEYVMLEAARSCLNGYKFPGGASPSPTCLTLLSITANR